MPRSNNEANTNLINGALDLPGVGQPFELIEAEAVEGVSELFHFTCRVSLHVGDGFIIGNHLGEPGTFYLIDQMQDQRCFHGVLTSGRFIDRFERDGQERDFFDLTFRPRLYLFSKNRDYRIYQDMSVPDIIASVLGRCNVLFKKALTKTYEPRGYCVQYGESDYSFMSRLMEEEGIYFFFEHTDSSHTLVMYDTKTAHPKAKHQEAIPFYRNTRSGSGVQVYAEPHIDEWKEFISTEGQNTFVVHDNLFAMTGQTFEGKTTVPDMDFYTRSKANLAEVYEFEGTFEYEQPSSGSEDASVGTKHIPAIKSASQIYSETAIAPRQFIQFHTNVLSLCSGTKFSITEHPLANVDGDYMITRVRAVVIGAGVVADGDHARTDGIFGECIHANRQWRTPLRTPRPVISGPETAVVTGPGGEEIFTDKYGRVKVQFHWDRQGKNDAQSSCWLRVSQTGGLGNIILPRIGHEVLVSFMQGNPDRPIIVGRVFNDIKANMPAYALPENKTIATWRSKSYKTSAGHSKHKTNQKLLSESKFASLTDKKFDDLMLNELRFEDKTQAEEVMLYAQLDLKTFVRADEEHAVGFNQKTWIGYNSERTVGNDSKITIMNDEVREIKGTNTVTVTKDQTVKLLANVDTQTTGTNKIKVTGENTEDYDNKSTVTVANTLSVKSSGADIKIEAATKIVLKCGSSEIELSPMGITMKGLKFQAEGSTTAVMKGSVSATVEGGVSSTLKGGVTAVVQGALVKIN